jgi:predicted nucleic acid-binding protein
MTRPTRKPLPVPLRWPLATTYWVLAELGDALAAPYQRAGFPALLVMLRFEPLITIAPLHGETFDAGVELYRSRPDKEWSLTDCISFTVMKERGITAALTGDHHFEQAGFTALLK